MTKDQCIEFANAAQAVKPFNISVTTACAAVGECLLKVVGDLSNLHAAVKFYAARHKETIKKSVPDVVVELLKIKEARGASDRYITDLKRRLQKRFAGDCTKDACAVTTAEVQEWLDALKLSSQSYANYRTVLHTLFEFAVARIMPLIIRLPARKESKSAMGILNFSRRLKLAACCPQPTHKRCLASR